MGPLIAALAIPTDAILWGDPTGKVMTVMTRAQLEQTVRGLAPEAVALKVLAKIDETADRPHFRKSVFHEENTFRIQYRPICNAPGCAA